MKELSLLSWNVNGIRALIKKEVYKESTFYEWVNDFSPDIFCLQEIKAQKEQLPKKLLNLDNYHSYWNGAERKGYSGVCTFCKTEPLSIQKGLGIEKYDKEGRLLLTEFPEFILCNVYFPNGKKNKERLQYKLNYYEEFLTFINDLRKEGKSIIFCGDVNTAHKPIDLTHPKANAKTSGFLPIEREWIDQVIDEGYFDSFRLLHPDEKEKYSWWSYRAVGARERNVGWRLDYFFVSNNLRENVAKAYILDDVMGSDHCPVGLDLQFK